MTLINCEISFNWTWSEDCVISSASGKTKFSVTATKCYVSFGTLSIQDDVKLLNQMKSGFKRIINWNKYQSKRTE